MNKKEEAWAIAFGDNTIYETLTGGNYRMFRQQAIFTTKDGAERFKKIIERNDCPPVKIIKVKITKI